MQKTSWAIDPSHSEVTFRVKHLMISSVTGKFGTFSGTAQTEGDDFSTATASFTAQVGSIHTNDAQRDGHLKSADFFDAEKHPEITFRLNKVSAAGGASEYNLEGELSIRGVTKNVKLHAEFGGIGKDPWGNTKAEISVTGTINRDDFGLTWNAALETGGVLVSQEVKINCEIQLLKEK